MKNTYKVLDDASSFDIETLTPGEIAVEIEKFTERTTKDADIIELKCRIFWTSVEEDQQYEGKEFDFPIFLGANSGVNVQILKGMFRKAGFDVNSWNKDGFPLSQALPGALKLLAWKHVPVIGTIKRQTNKNNETRNFFNLTKILRVNPDTGEKYEDALPDKVPNELVVEACNVVLEGENIQNVI